MSLIPLILIIYFSTNHEGVQADSVVPQIINMPFNFIELELVTDQLDRLTGWPPQTFPDPLHELIEPETDEAL